MVWYGVYASRLLDPMQKVRIRIFGMHYNDTGNFYSELEGQPLKTSKNGGRTTASFILPSQEQAVGDFR